jgi:hypothetical protein
MTDTGHRAPSLRSAIKQLAIIGFRQTCWLTCIALPLANPAYSQERGSKEWIRQMTTFIPLQQSECEIASNKVTLAHPHIDMFELMNRYHSFYFGPAIPPDPPSSYRDTKSGIIFYVESDGRHLAAMDANGKVLWVRNPFVDSNMCPYRSAHPFIVWIGPPGGGFGQHYLGPFRHVPDEKTNASIVKELDDEITRRRKALRTDENARFIGLRFNSSNFGYVNIRNGDYYDMGQN